MFRLLLESLLASTAFLCPPYHYCKILQPKTMSWRFPEHPCPGNPFTRHRQELVLVLPAYSYSCVTAQHCDALLPGSLRAPHPMPHPKVPGLAGRWHGWWLPASSSCCGVTHVVVGTSAALLKPLAKATLGLASVLHTMNGEGRKRLSPWQAALAPNLSQLRWQTPCAMLHWAVLPAGSVSWAAPEGNDCSCFTDK